MADRNDRQFKTIILTDRVKGREWSLHDNLTVQHFAPGYGGRQRGLLVVVNRQEHLEQFAEYGLAMIRLGEIDPSVLSADNEHRIKLNRFYETLARANALLLSDLNSGVGDSTLLIKMLENLRAAAARATWQKDALAANYTLGQNVRLSEQAKQWSLWEVMAPFAHAMLSGNSAEMSNIRMSLFGDIRPGLNSADGRRADALYKTLMAGTGPVSCGNGCSCWNTPELNRRSITEKYLAAVYPHLAGVSYAPRQLEIVEPSVRCAA